MVCNWHLGTEQRDALDAAARCWVVNDDGSETDTQGSMQDMLLGRHARHRFYICMRKLAWATGLELGVETKGGDILAS